MVTTRWEKSSNRKMSKMIELKPGEILYRDIEIGKLYYYVNSSATKKAIVPVLFELNESVQGSESHLKAIADYGFKSDFRYTVTISSYYESDQLIFERLFTDMGSAVECLVVELVKSGDDYFGTEFINLINGFNRVSENTPELLLKAV